MDGRGEVAVERTSLDYAVGVSGSVELELVDSILADHLQAYLAKPVVVLGSRKCEAISSNLVSLLLPVFDALFLRPGISSPRRHPHAWLRPILLRILAHIGEALREACIESPERMVIVPSIIEQEGVQNHS